MMVNEIDGVHTCAYQIVPGKAPFAEISKATPDYSDYETKRNQWPFSEYLQCLQRSTMIYNDL